MDVDDRVGEYIPRNYQAELMQIAVKKNTIIFLPTGSGKTFIAIMVLKQLSEPLRRHWREGGKITVMLVNTVALVEQHGKYLRRHTPFKVGEYTGEQNLDYWEKEIWDKECEEHQVLVMTCQILANALERHVLDLERINLLIFDECHRGVQDQPMRQVMMVFQHSSEQPRVLGLTATLLNGNCKPSQVEKLVLELETTYHSKVATVDALDDASIYSTNPHEQLMIYSSYHCSEVENDIIEQFDKLQGILRLIQVKELPKPASPNYAHLESSKGLKDLANLVNDAAYHVKVLGSYGGSIAIRCHLIQVECITKLCDNVKLLHALNAVKTALTYAQSQLKRHFTGNKKKDLFQFSSSKVKMLFGLLSQYKHKPLEDFCCIVFVQRRFTAKVIYHLLKDISDNLQECSFIKPNFIVGCNSNPFNTTRESLYTNKLNRDIISDFYAKKVNLLVSSNVLEEGVDVPTCRLVIKFDEPSDYRAYIQSKGRARHKESVYNIMVEETNSQKYTDRYRMFKELEATLNDYLIGKNESRDAPSKEQIWEMYNEHLIQPYYTKGPGSAHVTMVSACSLLAIYCNSFTSDIYTQYAPNWFIEKSSKLHRVIIEMPTVCPYIHPIEGPCMPTKKLAKRAAALEACKLLHKIGELDDYLRPRKQSSVTEDTEFLFSHHKTKSAEVAKQNKNVYKIKIPDVCEEKLRPHTELYMHVLQITSKFKESTGDTTSVVMKEIYNSDLTYSLLSSKQFPNICDFPVFVSSGELNVKLVSNAKKITLNPLEMDKLKEFTYFVYSDLLRLLKPFLVLNSEAMILLAPYSKSSQMICFNVIYENMRINAPKEMLVQEAKNLNVCDEEYYGKVVVPFYRTDFTEYVVTKVCYYMSPTTKFPSDKEDTYYQYYLLRYRYSIKNLAQPLLEVKALSSKLDCTKPRGAQKKRNRETYENDVIHLIPEMVTKQDFPPNLWIQAKILPTICDKIVQLLRAEELRVEICRSTNIGVLNCTSWLPLKLDRHLISYEADVCNESDDNDLTEDSRDIEEIKVNVLSIMSKMNCEIAKNTIQSEYPWEESEEPVDIERNMDVTVMEIHDYVNFLHKSVKQEAWEQLRPMKYQKQLALTYDKDYIFNPIETLQKKITTIGPELAEIYKALAIAKSDDIVNLERLETLGDSFLKFSSSLYIILNFPKFDEGKSTTLKSRLVSNKNLLILGNQKKLGSYVKFFSLNPKQDWTPLGYCLPDFILNSINFNNSLSNILIPREEQIDGIVQQKTIDKTSMELQDEQDLETEVNNSSTMYFMGNQVLPNKFIADCCEALIGVYLESCGISGGLKILDWLGLFANVENIAQLLEMPLPSPILSPNVTTEMIDYHINQYPLLEKSLGYNFKNRAYLLQAMTHASYVTNRITASYQRLEFLGDAVLDFLITCYIYENCKRLTPGDITDLRSALVNNVTFACLAVRCGFHKHLLAMSNKLQGYIDRFVKYQENKEFAIDDDVTILLNDDDYHLAEYVDVPKVLGDVFEALAGAVYLDSGRNLETVWKVFYRIMWKEIERFSNNVPKNSIRMLYETPGAHPEFYKAKTLDNGHIMVKLDFLINGEKKRVHGFGDHKKEAKKAAAKIALRLLGK